ncbi:hypothetical protein [Neosynechococcus sphagnicola]|uniref:hypothetical protein n=1 Tax=Neosynechococcus sphagnicola TaxID=1501145 RepID=UPI000559E3F3|nr:hypothetical protein [Neosynechococcus sphagnicola]
MTADLVYIQDALDEFRSFYWREADSYGLHPDQLVGTPVGANFGPVAIVPYLSRVHQVLETQIPAQFPCEFWDRQGHGWLFDLWISPIPLSEAATPQVLVMGCLQVKALDHASPNVPLPSTTPIPSADYYQKLLTQIAWNIRRTLDLDTIRQQAVEGLGKALGVSRCLICSYERGSESVTVMAEYCQPAFSPDAASSPGDRR